MKILVVDSSENSNVVIKDLFNELENQGFSFYFFCSQKKLLSQYSKKKRILKKVYLGPKFFTKSKIVFFTFFPFIFIKQLFLVARLKRKNKIKVILLIGLNEKIIFSPIAKILKLKSIWIEYPSVDYKNRINIYKKLYKRFSGFSIIIIFLNLTKSRLMASLLGRDYESSKLRVVPPGIRLGNFKRQENIFSSIAKGGQSIFVKKYFTIGTVLNSAQTSNIEILFLAAKLSLDVIPNLQIIIVDEDTEKKNLNNKNNINWLAKKMGIESLVWYVQESTFLNKWLDGFDVFVVTNNTPSIENLRVIINAMASGLPILAPRNYGFEDLVENSKTGFLLEAENNKVLAEQIIALYKDKRLMNNLGKEGIKRVKDKYQLEYMVSRFEKIFK